MTGPSSERTADADVATLRDLLSGSSGYKVDQARAALERLVARNQQLQEALAETLVAMEYAEGVLSRYPFDETQPAFAAQVLRDALASVRARTQA